MYSYISRYIRNSTIISNIAHLKKRLMVWFGMVFNLSLCTLFCCIADYEISVGNYMRYTDFKCDDMKHHPECHTTTGHPVTGPTPACHQLG